MIEMPRLPSSLARRDPPIRERPAKAALEVSGTESAFVRSFRHRTPALCPVSHRYLRPYPRARGGEAHLRFGEISESRPIPDSVRCERRGTQRPNRIGSCEKRGCPSSGNLHGRTGAVPVFFKPGTDDDPPRSEDSGARFPCDCPGKNPKNPGDGGNGIEAGGGSETIRLAIYRAACRETVHGNGAF